MNKQITEAVSHLKRGETIIYPTETLWALGCDATDEDAVTKLSEIKGKRESKGFVIVVEGLEMLSAYVGNITSTIRSIASSSTPTTVVFPKHQNLPPNVLAPDKTVAIRITQSALCKALIRSFGKPLVSTSANYSNDKPASNFEDLNAELLSAVQYVINLDETELMTQVPSRIVKLSPGGDIETIR